MKTHITSERHRVSNTDDVTCPAEHLTLFRQLITSMKKVRWPNKVVGEEGRMQVLKKSILEERLPT